MSPRIHPGVLKPCTRLADTRLCCGRSSTLFTVDDRYSAVSVRVLRTAHLCALLKIWW